MNHLYYFIWLLFMLFFLMECQTQKCLNHINNINKYFGEKADYVADSSTASHEKGCGPVQYWGVIRFDKNEFSTQNYSQLSQELIENIENKECGEKLKRWNYSEEDVLKKVENNIIFIAGSLKSKYKYLFRDNTDLKDYVFKDAVSGNKDIITQFMKNLLNRNEEYIDPNFNIITNNITDKIKSCTSFQTNRKDAESKKLIQTQEFQKMINDVKKNLEYKTNFDFEKLKLIYEICRFEKSVFAIESPWCSIFNEDQLKLLEYNEDLLSYYSKSYGNKYSKDIGCHIVKEMFTDLNNSIHSTNALKAIITFTDSIQFQTLLTSLGARKDSKLISAENYDNMRDYLWHTSEISPIGANFAAVMYDCYPPSKRVKFFLNEKPISIFDCPNGFCEWNSLHEKLKSLTEKCSYEFCTNVNSSALSKNYSLLIICISMIFIFLIRI